MEEGESCDCGESSCDSTDPCCDGSTCALYASADCSNSDDCCENCMFKAQNTVCRELDGSNSCDIEQEVCDGQTAECPPDLRYNEGEVCQSGDSFGMCYSGSCVSLETQCYEFGVSTGVSYGIADSSCSDFEPQWMVLSNKCSYRIQCEKTSDASCVALTGEKPNDGIPCNATGGAAQCVDEVCSPITRYFCILGF